ncbi:hypothetical protein PsorP6_000889 [Peronosclerospora sorghi]|uniref:Uncharacterized protein n=1 Tax=Peronosclerospora sorghi TaxID=230839 RepID=A0ACC0WT06_9STRA|nr:hypothetical protein PsorP6_000889 [Peronosclerospora sorghi]
MFNEEILVKGFLSCKSSAKTPCLIDGYSFSFLPSGTATARNTQFPSPITSCLMRMAFQIANCRKLAACGSEEAVCWDLDLRQVWARALFSDSNSNENLIFEEPLHLQYADVVVEHSVIPMLL